MRKKITIFFTMILLCFGFCKTNVYAAVSIGNGVYNILSALNRGKAVDVSGANKQNGANIQLWDYVDELQQQFYFIRVSGYYYKIQDVNSGKVLDVESGTRRSGVNVQLYQYNGTDAQLWKIESAGDGYYYLKNKLGYYLDVSGGSANNGSNIQVYSFNRTKAQKFKLRPTTIYTLISEGNYVFQSALNNQKVIDVEGGKSQSGTNIQLWESNDTNAQKYHVQLVSMGYYKIASAISGRVLDVAGGVRGSGINVHLYDYNGTDAQLWRFYNAGNGYYYIKNKLGYFIDVSNASTNNGVNIQVYSGNGSNAQKWKIVSTILKDNKKNSNVSSEWQMPMVNMYVCGNNWLEYYSKRPNRPYHLGIDVSSRSGDENVYAISNGTVVATGYNSSNGNFAIIEHNINGNTIYSFYAHLKNYCVYKNSSIAKGQKIGIFGNTGSASAGRHLHFAITNTLSRSGGYYGYGTISSGNRVIYNNIVYYNPFYVINNGKLP